MGLLVKIINTCTFYWYDSKTFMFNTVTPVKHLNIDISTINQWAYLNYTLQRILLMRRCFFLELCISHTCQVYVVPDGLPCKTTGGRLIMADKSIFNKHNSWRCPTAGLHGCMWGTHLTTSLKRHKGTHMFVVIG